MLLVEDEPEVRAVLRSHLRALGCRVTEAGTAEEALATLEGEGAADRPDLLLTDIALGPGRPGSELACDVEQRWPRTALLLMSGYASAQRGEFELLKKPFARAELAHAIARALARRGGG